MADDIDRANDMAQTLLEKQIDKARSQPKYSISPAECLNGCGEPPVKGGKFCSRECRQDWEYRAQIRKNQGLA